MDEPPVGDGPVDDPPMGEPPVEDEPLEDPRVDDPPVEADPVNGFLPMEEDGQDHPVEHDLVGDAAFEGVFAFPQNLKGSRPRRKHFLWLVYLHIAASIAVTALRMYGRLWVFRHH